MPLCRLPPAPDCRVVDYCNRVAAGSRIAGKRIRQACERHLRDLDDAHTRGLWWDAAEAERALEFFGLLQHSKGRWASQTFELSDWQAFCVGSIFGWRREDGTRRYRTALIEVPRKNGKTTLAAGIALYLLVADGEAGAEIYGAATKRDQAKLVFEDAKAMVLRSPDLSELVEPRKYSLQIPALRSKFEPLASESHSLDGLNPSAFVADEIHAWKSRDLWDVLVTGMGARDQPLALAITTAGDFSDSIYNEIHNDCEQILDGVIADDAVFAFIATPDLDADWREPIAWYQSNPNLGVSLREEELREAIESAKRKPAEENKTKRLRLNLRTSVLDAWLQLDRWDRGGNPFPLADLNGRTCFGGLDLASTSDLAAYSLLFPWGGGRGGVQEFRLRVWIWCPSDADGTRAAKLRQKIWPWVQGGHVELTEGNSIDFGRINDVIKESAELYDVRAVAFDPNNAEKLAQELATHGLNMLRFNQSPAHYNEAAKYFERLVLDGQLHHGGNPVLRWMASNVTIVENGAGMIMPSKKNSREKIDGVVASVMACGAYLQEPSGESVYERDGF